MARLFWLSDEAWALIEQYLPHGRLGKPRVDDRLARNYIAALALIAVVTERGHRAG